MVIGLVIGVPVCLFGLTLYKPLFFVTGTLFTIAIILLIFYSTFMKSTTESWAVWLVLGLSLLVGLIVGFIVMKISKLGAAILAFVGGYCGALLIWNTFLYLTTNEEWLFWTFTIGIAVICAILALVLFDHVVIISSALFGSWLCMAGIGVMAGGY